MFLNQLQEKNKGLFLELCIHVANADQRFIESEKEMIYSYCREMNVIQKIPDTVRDVDQILSELCSFSTEKEKRIIILEVMGIIYADNEFAKEEETLLSKIIEKLGVDKERIRHLLSLFEIYREVYKELLLAVG